MMASMLSNKKRSVHSCFLGELTEFQKMYLLIRDIYKHRTGGIHGFNKSFAQIVKWSPAMISNCKSGKINAKLTCEQLNSISHEYKVDLETLVKVGSGHENIVKGQ